MNVISLLVWWADTGHPPTSAALRYLAEDYEGAKKNHQSALIRTGTSESVTGLLRYNIDLANICLLPSEQQK